MINKIFVFTKRSEQYLKLTFFPGFDTSGHMFRCEFDVTFVIKSLQKQVILCTSAVDSKIFQFDSNSRVWI